MPAFRRVEGSQAGPSALGILVPPGARTLVILRPRALEWDLLPLQDRDEGFCEFDRETAAGIARGIQQALLVLGMDPNQVLAHTELAKVYARRHDYEGFYEQEIEFREQLKYPPLSRVALPEKMKNCCRGRVRDHMCLQNVFSIRCLEGIEREQVQAAVRNDDDPCHGTFLDRRRQEQFEEFLARRNIAVP